MATLSRYSGAKDLENARHQIQHQHSETIDTTRGEHADIFEFNLSLKSKLIIM
jgi:hypothetical protein